MSTTTTKKRRPIVGYRTMTAAQRYNARMERLFEDCKDAQTRFNASSRVELSNPQGDKVMSSTTKPIRFGSGRTETAFSREVNAPDDDAPAPTPTQGEHTPLPWDFAIYQGVAHITPDLGRYSLAKLESDNYDADARFIVKAVNNHEKLVAALRECVDRVSQSITVGDLTGDEAVYVMRVLRDVAAKGRAVLADAQGEE